MAETSSYRRSLGLFELVSLGVGGTIGSGIFVVPGIAARLTGVWSLCAWLIVAVSASCVLYSLASVSARFTDSGSFYSLFESVFGRKAAVPLIVLYLISSIFGISTIAAGIGQYIGYFGLAQVLVIEIGVIAGFCGINIIGIALAGKTETILTLIKIVPLVLIALLLLPFVRPENLVPAAPLTAAGLFATVIIVYWPFTGFEISAIPVEETTDPRMIRKSLLCVMAIVVSVYLLLNIALMGSVGVTGTRSISCAGCIRCRTYTGRRRAGGCLYRHRCHALGDQCVYCRDFKDSPEPLGTVWHPPAPGSGWPGTPVSALVAGCGIAAGLLLFSNHFDQLASISVITTLIPYLFFCIASWILIRETRMRVVSAVGAFSTFAILVLYFFV